MNTSVFFQLPALFFLSGILASFDEYERHKRMYDLLSAGSETLENVQEIFDNATFDFNDDFDSLDLLSDSVNAEVVTYVFSKSVNMENSLDRAKAIRKILERNLYDAYVFMKSELVPGEPKYEIILACLEEIKRDKYPELNQDLAFSFGNLILLGKLPLIKKFIEAGFEPPLFISFRLDSIKSQNVETINFLVDHGLDITRDCQSIYGFMESGELTVSDFELYLKHGLSLDLKWEGSNWLELALEASNFDIAELLYEKSLRVSREKLGNDYHFSDMKLNVEKFIARMAMKKAFEKVKLMLIGAGEGESLLYSIPKEMIHEVVMPIYELEKEDLFQKLYV